MTTDPCVYTSPEGQAKCLAVYETALVGYMLSTDQPEIVNDRIVQFLA
jgi:hypothetical protein